MLPLAVFVGLVVCHAQGKPYMWWAAILVPIYWILQSIAAIKAIYQLIFRPFFWEKTVHGLSQSPLSTVHYPVIPNGEKQS